MTVTYQHLVGSFENLDKTMAFHIGDDWDNTNTNSVTPIVENGTDEPDYEAQFDCGGANKILVNTIDRDFTLTDDEVNSDTVHSVREEIIITVIAESREMRILIENEINRILWELSPNSSTRLTKSDSSNSHVDHFEKSEVSFAQIDLPDNEWAFMQGSEGSLFCIYYKFRS